MSWLFGKKKTPQGVQLLLEGISPRPLATVAEYHKYLCRIVARKQTYA